jgi:hypothetical protein
MLLVFLPFTFIASTFNIHVHTLTVSLIIQPFSIVSVSIGMKEFTFSASLIILPFTFIPTVIWPDHSSFTMSQPSFPLSSVDSPCFVSMSSLLQWCISIVFTFKCFSCFIRLKIFRCNFLCQNHNFVFTSL